MENDSNSFWSSLYESKTATPSAKTPQVKPMEQVNAQSQLNQQTVKTATPAKIPWYKTTGPTIVKGAERFSDKVYVDSKGVLTYGYGFTRNVDTEKPVRRGDYVSKQRADTHLENMMKKWDEGMAKKYPDTWSVFDDNYKAGIFSLSHNTTNRPDFEHAPRMHEMLSRKKDMLDEGFFYDVEKEVLHWGDTKDPELIPRRRMDTHFMRTGEFYDQGWFLKGDEPSKGEPKKNVKK